MPPASAPRQPHPEDSDRDDLGQLISIGTGQQANHSPVTPWIPPGPSLVVSPGLSHGRREAVVYHEGQVEARIGGGFEQGQLTEAARKEIEGVANRLRCRMDDLNIVEGRFMPNAKSLEGMDLF